MRVRVLILTVAAVGAFAPAAGAALPADVRVLSHDDARELPGYQLSGAFSPSDTVVLSVDAAGRESPDHERVVRVRAMS